MGRNPLVNTKFTRPVMEVRKSSPRAHKGAKLEQARASTPPPPRRWQCVKMRTDWTGPRIGISLGARHWVILYVSIRVGKSLFLHYVICWSSQETLLPLKRHPNKMWTICGREKLSRCVARQARAVTKGETYPQGSPNHSTSESWIMSHELVVTNH